MELGVNLLNQILTGALQCSRERPTHDLIRYFLQVH